MRSSIFDKVYLRIIKEANDTSNIESQRISDDETLEKLKNLGFKYDSGKIEKTYSEGGKLCFVGSKAFADNMNDSGMNDMAWTTSFKGRYGSLEYGPVETYQTLFDAVAGALEWAETAIEAPVADDEEVDQFVLSAEREALKELKSIYKVKYGIYNEQLTEREYNVTESTLESLGFAKSENSYTKAYNGMKLVFFYSDDEWQVYFRSPWGKIEYGPEYSYSSIGQAVGALVEWKDAVKQEAEEEGTDPDLIKAAEMATAELTGTVTESARRRRNARRTKVIKEAANSITESTITARLKSIGFKGEDVRHFTKDYDDMKLVFYREDDGYSVYFISEFGMTEYGPDTIFESVYEAVQGFLAWVPTIKEQYEEDRDSIDPDLIAAADIAAVELQSIIS